MQSFVQLRNYITIYTTQRSIDMIVSQEGTSCVCVCLLASESVHKYVLTANHYRNARSSFRYHREYKVDHRGACNLNQSSVYKATSTYEMIFDFGFGLKIDSIQKF